jgi:hypothetical protein
VFQNRLPKFILSKLISFIDIINSLEPDKVLNSTDQAIIQDQTEEINRMMEFLLCDIKMLKIGGLLSNNSTYGKLNIMSELMHSIEIFWSTGSYWKLTDLSNLLSKINTAFSYNSINLSFKNPAEKDRLLKVMLEISTDLHKYGAMSKGSVWFAICRKPMFAAPYQMKWSLVQKFHARHHRIKAVSKAKFLGCKSSATLDAYLLPCLFSNDEVRENEAILNWPTVIICFPNGGYLEYFYFQWEWVNFYLEQGINVFMWNYRGYYNSTGTPTSKNILDDVETVYDFLKDTIKVKGPIGCHGESLGGYAASHLGKHRALKFLFVDRSFGSFQKLIQAKYGSCQHKIFKWISSFDIENESNFIDTKWFKIVAQDSQDTVINYMGDLKNGISQKMLLNSIEPNKLNIVDAIDLYECYNKFESDKHQMYILYKIQLQVNKTAEKGPSIIKLGTEPNRHKKSSKDKVDLAYTKTSSRGSTFKSITNSIQLKKNDIEENKHEDLNERWNVRS